MSIILYCSRCGTEDQSKFASARLARYKTPGRKSNWCIECQKTVDDRRKKNSDMTRIIECPNCRNSGDFSSGLFAKARYQKARGSCLCKKCRRLKDKTWKNYEYRRIRRNQAKRIKTILRKYTSMRQNTVSLIGCTPEELVTHLESQFKPGMSWDNYAIDGWHIDHVKPISSFDLSNEDEMKACFHYTNLQPLWAKDNYAKGDRC